MIIIINFKRIIIFPIRLNVTFKNISSLYDFLDGHGYIILTFTIKCYKCTVMLLKYVNYQYFKPYNWIIKFLHGLFELVVRFEFFFLLLISGIEFFCNIIILFFMYRTRIIIQIKYSLILFPSVPISKSNSCQIWLNR